jgi:NADH-quinone oxidoreductase subunit G
VDLCPVGALLDKDFLFAQRVWFLKETPSIDGLTASGDNIRIDHNEGKVYRVKPRTNLKVNKWWITDEVRYGWKFVHSEARISSPMRKQFGVAVECDHSRVRQGRRDLPARCRTASSPRSSSAPMLTCEEAYLLAKFAKAIDKNAVLAGPLRARSAGRTRSTPSVQGRGPQGVQVCGEKAPNAAACGACWAFGPVIEFWRPAPPHGVVRRATSAASC